MKITLVNDKDEIIGYKEREDRNQNDIIRVTGLCVYNSNKKVLIARRALSKTHHPGKWGPSVAGTVEQGETYLSNILKETEEELGILIKERDLFIGPHIFMVKDRKHGQMFFVRLDLPIEAFTIQREEVEEVRWISLSDLIEWMNNKPDEFVVSFNHSLQNIVDFLKK